MIVGCYTMDLYCDNPKCEAVFAGLDGHRDGIQMGFTGSTRAACARQARRVGWRVGRTKAYCPRCLAGHLLGGA